MGHDFCGWYYKCQTNEHAAALIPAVHTGGDGRSCSLQLICDGENWNISLPGRQLRMSRSRPWALLDGSSFQGDGIRLSLHTDALSAEGALRFGPPSPIRYDIMGPFRYVPFMECRHSVYSMQHRVDGRLSINGRDYCFDGGTGYIEGDRGRSFPRHYLWTQCCFEAGSLMLAAAEIPLGPIRFTGIIGVIQAQGEEYRLATYLGARAEEIGGGRIQVRQGDMVLTAALLEQSACRLQAPETGAMTRTIRENVSCRARYCLKKGGRTLLELDTPSASFEYEYP